MKQLQPAPSVGNNRAYYTHFTNKYKQPVWTDFRVKWGLDLWAKGQSASDVGALLGVSRNAVLGKLHRSVSVLVDKQDGIWQKPPEVYPHKRFVHTGRQLFFARHIYMPHSLLPAEILVPGGAHDDQACAWPIGDPCNAGFHFCGERKVFGSSYCSKHAAAAYGGAA